MDKKVKNNDMSFYEGYFDGSAKPNPGMMKIGGFIQTSDKKVVNQFSAKLWHGTNNEAEYLSFLRLLNEALKQDIKKIRLYGDSALVVNQVNLTWKAKDERMRAFRNEAILLLDRFHEWRLEHIKRGLNMEADFLTK
jgi:ribonuclease HI